MTQQLTFLKQDLQYGGNHNLGKAKIIRPLSTRKPIHVTLRSSRAKGALSLRRHKPKIERILELQSRRWGVRIYRSSINGNHIHLALRGQNRREIQNFFRSIAGLIARVVTKAQRGRPFGKFWDNVLWSRVVEWGRAFHTLTGYVFQNILEAEGLVPYVRRKGSHHAEFIARVADPSP
jgi:REP element-mobilizing transposase RayT